MADAEPSPNPFVRYRHRLHSYHVAREAGWSDEDVMDIAEVTGLFNMSNRMASGLGWAPNPEYETLGR